MQGRHRGVVAGASRHARPAAWAVATIGRCCRRREIGEEGPVEALTRIDAERRSIYEEVASVVVEVDGLAPAAAADRVVRADAAVRESAYLAGRGRPMITVPVGLGPRAYDVIVGAGARRLLPEVLPAGVERVALVTQEDVETDVDAGVPSETFVVEEGEGAKTLATVEQLCRDFARFGLSRSDAVVAVGGGVVSDVAGFAASVFNRGIRYVNVPTTLLAQVDAAIGGKTGVNLPEGKNLVGTFWQPAAVLCDIETLGTLPAREWSSGRGEMAKYAFLGEGLLEHGRPGAGILGLPLDEQVATCVSIKAAVVIEDEREAGHRMVLNYGHTLAHALEASSFGPEAKWDLRHGEAVAIGLVFSALLARRLGRIDDGRRRVAPEGGGWVRPALRHPGGRLGPFPRRIHGEGQKGAP